MRGSLGLRGPGRRASDFRRRTKVVHSRRPPTMSAWRALVRFGQADIVGGRQTNNGFGEAWVVKINRGGTPQKSLRRRTRVPALDEEHRRDADATLLVPFYTPKSFLMRSSQEGPV